MRLIDADKLIAELMNNSLNIEDDGRLIIYLHDNAICEYWAKYKHRADKRIGDNE